MDGRAELVLRCATRRRSELGGLSDAAYSELRASAEANPERFVTTTADESFAEVVRALAQMEADAADDDLLDDDQYLRARSQRLARLSEACDRALALDGDNLDARLLKILAADERPDVLIAQLEALDREVRPSDEQAEPVGQSWSNVYARPWLRLKAALSRTYLEAARYRASANACEQLLSLSPDDELGARLTLALALSRLEDEAALDALDARFGRRGNAWLHLARVLVLYKLDRLPAARRALRGFCELCDGGASALLHPMFVDIYLPDRPSFTPGSFEEAAMAVREADPIVVDTPDFIGWCAEQPSVTEMAERYSDEHGLDW